MALLFSYLSYFGPAVDWGDISNEIIFHQVRDMLQSHFPRLMMVLPHVQVRKYLLRMEHVGTTPSKFWKPNFLVFVNDCDVGVLGLCNALKKGGLMVLAQVSLKLAR